MRRLFEKLSSLFSNVVYYPGCLTRFVLPEIQKKYEKILEELGIDFVTVEELRCCGSPVKNAGYRKEFSDLKEKNMELLKEYGVSKIITNCPACYNVLKEIHPKVFHITEILYEKLSVKHSWDTTCVYHDPCHLGRYAGIYNEPRDILKKCGFELLEMEWCKEKSMCCGGGGGFRTNFTEISRDIAKRRVDMAVKTGAEVLVTTCPLCYLQLKEAAGKEIEVLELSEVVTYALGIIENRV